MTKDELTDALAVANAKIAELEEKLATEDTATGQSVPHPDVIAGIRSILRLLPDARISTSYLSPNQWKLVAVAADYLKGVVTPVAPSAGEQG